ncbi:MAG: hypothetical protein MZV64_31145 [Ignavibacteriales bacterium]|nr:hypothetical protein [Ignavibacteriales bacterium]
MEKHFGNGSRLLVILDPISDDTSGVQILLMILMVMESPIAGPESGITKPLANMFGTGLHLSQDATNADLEVFGQWMTKRKF